MGRELKRVEMDFDWPLNKTWGGYINPYYSQSIKCQHCDGGGLSKQAKHLSDMWYGHAEFHPEDKGSTPYTTDHPEIRKFAERNVSSAPDYYGPLNEENIDREAQRLCNLFNSQWCHHLSQADVDSLIKHNRLTDLTHQWTKDGGWQPKDPPVNPTAKEVNDYSINGHCHDSINNWVCVKSECERSGYETKCEKCDGDGDVWPSDDIKEKCEKWEKEDPPSGDGFQLWENTSEGSPISPVFETVDELCLWCADNATTFGSFKASFEDWKLMLEASFVCHKEGSNIFI